LSWLLENPVCQAGISAHISALFTRTFSLGFLLTAKAAPYKQTSAWYSSSIAWTSSVDHLSIVFDLKVMASFLDSQFLINICITSRLGHPSIHPSIILTAYPGPGRGGSWRSPPGFLLPSHALQFLLGDPEAFPGQKG